MSVNRGRVGYCPQSDCLDDHLTVAETLTIYCRLAGLDRVQASNSVQFSSLFHFAQGNANCTVFQSICIINCTYILFVFIYPIHDIVYYIMSVVWK